MLNDFFETIIDDPRIGTSHIVIYLALLHTWQVKGCPVTMEVATFEMLKLTKFRKKDTYLLRIKDLAAFGYINYQPAENEYLKAEIAFRRLV